MGGACRGPEAATRGQRSFYHLLFWNLAVHCCKRLVLGDLETLVHQVKDGVSTRRRRLRGSPGSDGSTPSRDRRGTAVFRDALNARRSAAN